MVRNFARSYALFSSNHHEGFLQSLRCFRPVRVLLLKTSSKSFASKVENPLFDRLRVESVLEFISIIWTAVFTRDSLVCGCTESMCRMVSSSRFCVLFTRRLSVFLSSVRCISWDRGKFSSYSDRRPLSSMWLTMRLRNSLKTSLDEQSSIFYMLTWVSLIYYPSMILISYLNRLFDQGVGTLISLLFNSRTLKLSFSLPSFLSLLLYLWSC